MVSNDEIRLRLEAKRTGQDSEDLQKIQESYEHGGYLICGQCGSYYELQPGKSPEDFSLDCDCGEKLVYQESLNVIEKETPKSKSSSNSIILMVILGIGFVFAFLFFITPLISIFYIMLLSTSVEGNSLGLFVVLILILTIIFLAGFTVYYLIKVKLRHNR